MSTTKEEDTIQCQIFISVPLKAIWNFISNLFTNKNEQKEEEEVICTGVKIPTTNSQRDDDVIYVKTVDPVVEISKEKFIQNIHEKTIPLKPLK